MSRGRLKRIRKLAEDIREEMRSAEPKSMCELPFECHGERTDEYYDVIGRLLETIQLGDLLLGGWHIGTVLLLLISETARRRAEGHALWHCIAEWLPLQLRWELLENGQPTELLKSLIVKAVKKLNLRHAFWDRSIRQPYYVTVHLQFGFTRSAVENRLAGWLAGENRTVAVERLLSGPQASRSFQRLWSGLERFRSDRISDEELRGVLEDNPWVLPDWHDLLVDVVRESRRTGRANTIAADGVDPDAFLGPPAGVWDPVHGPYFICPWTGAIDSSEWTHVDLYVGETPVARAVRGPDGRLQLHGESVRLTADESIRRVALVDPEGAVVREQTVCLWPEEEAVSVYQVRKKGRLVPIGAKMARDRPHVIWTRGDLRVVPEPDVWFRGGTEELPWTAWHVGQEWDTVLPRVETPDGDVVWRAEDFLRADSTQAAAGDGLQVSVRGRDRVAVGDRISLVVHGVPSDAKLVSARVNQRDATVHGALLTGVLIRPEDAWRGVLHVNLQIEWDGETSSVRCRCDPLLEDAVIRTEDEYHACRSERTITADLCRRSMFRIFCRDVEKPVISEGDRFVRNVGKRPHTLAEVSGTGAPLVVYRGLFDAHVELVRIARGVVDQGVVAEVRSEETGWKLEFTSPLKPGPDHAVICWPCLDGRRPTVISSDCLSVSPDAQTWTVPCPICLGRSTSVVAVRYCGEWLGGALHGEWDAFFERLDELDAPPEETARLVRWLRLPLLLPARDGSPRFAPFAHRHAARLLWAWLDEVPDAPHPAEFCVSHSRDDHTGEFVRNLFADWKPNEEAVEELCALLGTQTPDDPMGDVFVSIAPLDPILAGKLARCWLLRGPSERRHLLFQRLTAWYHRLFDEPVEEETSFYPDASAFFEQDSSEGVRLDPYFAESLAQEAVDRMIGRRQGKLARFNLYAALHIHRFREYAIRRILQHLLAESTAV